MSACPCGSGEVYEKCCGRYVDGRASAPTAEALMRSRFTAFARRKLDYIERTCASEMRETFDRSGAERGADTVKWLSLQVLGTSGGGAMEDTGTVEFAATYLADGTIREHRENSAFRREDGGWVYVAGEIAPDAAGAIRVGRNDPCPCGSGKKFKKCCGA
ncbi:MAG: YchJ family protein [Alphaproteobacteria bacterium]